MKLSEFKALLAKVKSISFYLENGEIVPEHFHITEVGLLSKHFVDCGGTVRTDKKICMQVWTADDIEHRLLPEKLLGIIELAEKELCLEDLEVIVEYQSTTVSNYGLKFGLNEFIMTNTLTDCLAKDKCGIPPIKKKIRLSDLTIIDNKNCCKPGDKCC